MKVSNFLKKVVEENKTDILVNGYLLLFNESMWLLEVRIGHLTEKIKELVTKVNQDIITATIHNIKAENNRTRLFCI